MFCLIWTLFHWKLVKILLVVAIDFPAQPEWHLIAPIGSINNEIINVHLSVACSTINNTTSEFYLYFSLITFFFFSDKKKSVSPHASIDKCNLIDIISRNLTKCHQLLIHNDIAKTYQHSLNFIAPFLFDKNTRNSTKKNREMHGQEEKQICRDERNENAQYFQFFYRYILSTINSLIRNYTKISINFTVTYNNIIHEP